MRRTDELTVFEQAGVFDPLEIELARRLAGLAVEAEALRGREWTPNRVDRLALAMAARAPRMGHVCLDLASTGTIRPVRTEDDEGTPLQDLDWPDTGAWLAALRDSPLCRIAGDERDTPLVLEAAGDDGGRLYLDRYWRYERDVQDQVLARLALSPTDVDLGLLKEGLTHLLRPSTGVGLPVIQGQQVAAMLSVMNRFSILSGGPGTGKTTTVTVILLLVLQQARARDPEHVPHVHLMAPTGKAAARMSESIRENLQAFRERLATDGLGPRFDPAILDMVPLEAKTLHRGLGLLPDRPSQPRYHARNPLPADLVIVDEASMVDIGTMARLLQALPREARVILIGDRNQLASVECGAVLGDLCGVGLSPLPGVSPRIASLVKDLLGVESHDVTQRTPDVLTEYRVPTSQFGAPIRDAVMHLSAPVRFSADGGIGRAARAIQEAGTTEGLDAVVQLISVDAKTGPDGRSGVPQLAWIDLASTHDIDRIKPMVLGHYLPVLSKAIASMRASDLSEDSRRKAAADALTALAGFRVLCTHRRGPRGVETINRLVRDWLAGPLAVNRDDWYAGRPIMVTRNDYHAGLFNGDIGLVLPDPRHDGSLMAFFPWPGDEQVRAFPRGGLPPHETVFAMTVHKSQGSQFNEVLMLLPAKPSDLVTRELVYTGITRARSGVTVAGNAKVLREAVRRPVHRASGLRDKVWGA